ncbi:MAG: hypothetical protein ACRDQF_19635 [Thermocrispum sp.]
MLADGVVVQPELRRQFLFAVPGGRLRSIGSGDLIDARDVTDTRSVVSRHREEMREPAVLPVAQERYAGGGMRRALVILLVVLVLVTGLPVMMGMSGMASCETCDPVVLGAMTCLAVLAGAVLVLPTMMGVRFRTRHRSMRARLLVHLVERPPQLIPA